MAIQTTKEENTIEIPNAALKALVQEVTAGAVRDLYTGRKTLSPIDFSSDGFKEMDPALRKGCENLGAVSLGRTDGTVVCLESATFLDREEPGIIGTVLHRGQWIGRAAVFEEDCHRAFDAILSMVDIFEKRHRDSTKEEE